MYDNSFSSQRLKEVEGDPHVYVIDGKIWEVKAGNYSDEKFPVFIGNEVLDPMIIESVADINSVLDSAQCPHIEDMELSDAIKLIPERLLNLFVEVPVDFKSSFTNNIVNAIQDIAGIPIAPQGRLFSSKKHYNACLYDYNNDILETTVDEETGKEIVKHLTNKLFLKDEIVISTGSEVEMKDYCNPNYIPIHPERKRFLHIDQSISGDSTGVSCCFVDHVSHAPDGTTIKHIKVDWIVRVVPPKPPHKIDIAKVRGIITYLTNAYGIQWGMISYDTYACLTGDSEVLTTDGIKFIKDVNRGDYIWNGKSFVKCLNTFKYKNVPTKILKFKDGRFIEGTPNHKLHCFTHFDQRGGKYNPNFEYKCLEDFKVGDKIHTNLNVYDIKDYKEWVGYERSSHSKHINDINILDENLAYILGFYIGNGHLSWDGLDLCSGHKDILSYVKDIASEVFGYNFEFNKEHTNYYNFSIFSVPFVRSMKLNGFDKVSTRDKRIPSIVKNSPINVVKAFLSGIVDADGHCYNTGRVSISSSSLYLLRDIQNLLMMRLGIKSIISNNGKGGYKGSGITYSLGIYANEFYNNFDVYNMSYIVGRNKKDITGRKIYTKVVSIEDSMNDVYDIEVEGHEYIVNGMYSHNSQEAIQSLEKDGFSCQFRSVDRTDEAYLTLVDYIYAGNIKLPYHPVFERELFNLVHFRQRRKVDHPSDGSKDVSDSVAGALMNCVEDEGVYEVLRENDIGYYTDGVDYTQDMDEVDILLSNF